MHFFKLQTNLTTNNRATIYSAYTMFRFILFEWNWNKQARTRNRTKTQFLSHYRSDFQPYRMTTPIQSTQTHLYV